MLTCEQRKLKCASGLWLKVALKSTRSGWARKSVRHFGRHFKCLSPHKLLSAIKSGCNCNSKSWCSSAAIVAAGIGMNVWHSTPRLHVIGDITSRESSVGLRMEELCGRRFKRTCIEQPGYHSSQWTIMRPTDKSSPKGNLINRHQLTILTSDHELQTSKITQ